MALSTNRIAYGIHSMAPYQRSDNMPYGILKVIGGGTLSLSAEFEDLFGGSNKYAWASEAKTIDSTFVSTVKSMPDFLFELYLGASVSTTAASTTGSIVDALANVLGTSLFDATTGIASIGVKSGSEADLKDAKYIVKAVSSTTVDVYALTDISFSNGTDISYEDDALKITASALTITTGAAVEIPNTGLELTGGSGTIAFVTADTGDCRVASAHSGVSEITIGQSASVFAEHGIVALGAKRADNSLFEIDIFKAVGAGFPIALAESTFSIPELTIKLLYDETLNAIAKITATAG